MSDLKVEMLEDLLDAERRMVRKLNDQLAEANARADAAEATLKRIRNLARYSNLAEIRAGRIVQWSVESDNGALIMADELDEALEQTP